MLRAVAFCVRAYVKFKSSGTVGIHLPKVGIKLYYLFFSLRLCQKSQPFFSFLVALMDTSVLTQIFNFTC